jgi:hypothetical protein
MSGRQEREKIEEVRGIGRIREKVSSRAGQKKEPGV